MVNAGKSSCKIYSMTVFTQNLFLKDDLAIYLSPDDCKVLFSVKEAKVMLALSLLWRVVSILYARYQTKIDS